MSTFECKCHWCRKSLIRKTQGVEVRFHFCDMKCKAEYQRTQKPVTREWLNQKYIVEGLDTTQIGHLVGRDPKSVWNWLKDFGIPTRPRGAATATRFESGHKRGVGRKLSAKSRKKIGDKCKDRGAIPYDPAIGPNGGRRGADHPSWKGGITPERQAFYETPEWKSAARAVKKRDKSTCQRCGKVKKRGDPFDIHHKVGFACVELRAVVRNLVYLCEPCHYWVHSKNNVNRDFIEEA